MHAHIHTYVHTYSLTYVYTYIHTCIHAYRHTCVHRYIHTYIHASICTCIHASMHARRPFAAKAWTPLAAARPVRRPCSSVADRTLANDHWRAFRFKFWGLWQHGTLDIGIKAFWLMARWSEPQAVFLFRIIGRQPELKKRIPVLNLSAFVVSLGTAFAEA